MARSDVRVHSVCADSESVLSKVTICRLALILSFVHKFDTQNRLQRLLKACSQWLCPHDISLCDFLPSSEPLPPSLQTSLLATQVPLPSLCAQASDVQGQPRQLSYLPTP
eukprot:674929-Rhodomonas_salina.5